MSRKTILTALAYLGGEAILISAFILWRGETPDNVLILNIVVSSIILTLSFIDLFLPLVNLQDRTGRGVGSLGVRWWVVGFYAIASVGVMLGCNLYADVGFQAQLIIHCVLLLLLLIGIVAMFHSSDKVAEVYEKEQLLQSGVEQMREVMSELVDLVALEPVLSDVQKNQVMRLNDRMRYLSPSNNERAAQLESQFVEAVRMIQIAMSGEVRNEEKIDTLIKKAELIFEKRKSLFSN